MALSMKTSNVHRSTAVLEPAMFAAVDLHHTPALTQPVQHPPGDRLPGPGQTSRYRHLGVNPTLLSTGAIWQGSVRPEDLSV